jgi:PadR family transcriptional regulator, regulatory protein AphA
MKKKRTDRRDTTIVAGRREVAPPRIKASLELALLGLIAEQHPRSGYDLVQTFRASMVHYWHAHPGQIYPTLERMERDGWIAGREVIQRGRPNKRIYSISSEGRRVLLEWLGSPYEQLKMKNPPLLKSRFLGHLGADGARAKFAEMRGAMASYLEVLRGCERAIAEHGGAYRDVNQMFVYFTLRRGIEFARNEVEFCEWAIAQIDRHRELFGEGAATSPAPRSEPGRVSRRG